MRIMEHAPANRSPHHGSNAATSKVMQQMNEGVAFVQALKANNDGAADGNEGLVVEQDVRQHEVEEEGVVNSHTIIVKSRQQYDLGVVYEVRDDETFEAIYGDYASRVDLSTTEIVLKKFGMVIAPTATVSSARIRTGDIIYVSGVDPSKNMNTKFKFFYIRNTCTPPTELRVYGKLTSKLWRLFDKWAAEVNKDPNCLKLMHQDLELKRDKIIGQSGIKNSDYVYAFPEF
ncbi:uncharacterized protein LOC110703164 [Chenopodium quinoa]|uniref:uncharacterized protein LOC110703164 n=1 Tax=Chenopodium quinoa TaxID=63459 RepID=UPI000B77E472|nr:uncharacterized protein LOC110703164 [Chenopodium quinoa]